MKSEINQALDIAEGIEMELYGLLDCIQDEEFDRALYNVGEAVTAIRRAIDALQLVAESNEKRDVEITK